MTVQRGIFVSGRASMIYKSPTKRRYQISLRVVCQIATLCIPFENYSQISISRETQEVQKNVFPKSCGLLTGFFLALVGDIQLWRHSSSGYRLIMPRNIFERDMITKPISNAMKTWNSMSFVMKEGVEE